MKSKKELELTTKDELIEWIFVELKKYKAGQRSSVEELLDLYFGGKNYHRINPIEINSIVFLKSREYQFILDTSDNYGLNISKYNYKQSFAVWKKRRYMSDDEFRDLCEEYDSLFEKISPDDEKFDTIKRDILNVWKKDCNGIIPIESKVKPIIDYYKEHNEFNMPIVVTCHGEKYEFKDKYLIYYAAQRMRLNEIPAEMGTPEEIKQRDEYRNIGTLVWLKDYSDVGEIIEVSYKNITIKLDNGKVVRYDLIKCLEANMIRCL